MWKSPFRAASGRIRPTLATALCLVALACSACRLDLSVDVEVDRNGAGTVAVAVTADEELQAMATQAGGDPLDELVRAGQDLRGAGWRTQDRSGAEGARTVTLSAGFDSPEQFDRVMALLAEALDAEEAELLDPWQLVVTDDQLRLTGAAAAVPRRAVRDYGVTPRQATRLLQRNEAFGYQVHVRLPGEVVSSTADTTDGQTLSWTVPVGRRVAVEAVGVRPGPPWLRAVVGAVAGAVLAGALLWLITRRRRRPSPARPSP
ncbi:MAG TPA: hypothetical protein VM307_09310 [Egibacteraceae bacterium]|nr:hypothetical protein [Egibacteraceae bacterium]